MLALLYNKDTYFLNLCEKSYIFKHTQHRQKRSFIKQQLYLVMSNFWIYLTGGAKKLIINVINLFST